MICPSQFVAGERIEHAGPEEGGAYEEVDDVKHGTAPSLCIAFMDRDPTSGLSKRIGPAFEQMLRCCAKMVISDI